MFQANPSQSLHAAATPLRMEAVVKRYGDRTVVDGLNLRVERGEVVALLGPNGAGKSTSIAMAMGFEAVSSGSVHVSGVDVAMHPHTARGHVSYIPENVNLYPMLTGLENLEYFAALSGLSPSQSELRDALTDAGLPLAAQSRRVGEYSKGMRQKAGIAIAMLRRCSVLLLDEPTSGLDPLASDEFNTLLLQTASHGVGILMATHDISRALEIATQVSIMRHGRIVGSYRQAEFATTDVQAIYLRMMRGA